MNGRTPLLERQVGQLFWIGFHGTTLTPELRSLLDHVRPGGLILFSRNIENARQVRSLTDALHRNGSPPPFIALDQEGGRVNRLKTILGPIPPNIELAARRDAEREIRRHSRSTAAALRSLGFNVNFAPVLDLSEVNSANGIGDRAYGERPEEVSRLAAVFLKEHLRAGVLPVGKHFPGLGSAGGDTHRILPIIDKARAALWKEDLLPYRRLRRWLPIVMAGHACYPALQGRDRSPATLSAGVIETLLRRRIGYTGLVLTDDLEMGAVEQSVGAGVQALAALRAGNDGLMFCATGEKIVEAFEAVLAAVRGREVDPRRLKRSLRRIAALKRRLPERRPPFATATVERARRELARLGGGTDAGPDPTARS